MKIVFLSHETEGVTGFPSAFADYLKLKNAKLVYIKFPFFMSTKKEISVEYYKGERLINQEKSSIRFYRPELLSYLKDVLWLLIWGRSHVRGADFVLASNNLLGFVAYLFRKWGLIKRFSYLVVDYSPTRFGNPLAEWLYRKLDSFVATRADSVWTMSLEMLKGREADGRFRLTDVNYRLAPMGNNSAQIFANGPVPNDPKQLVFIGNANAKNVRADFLLHVVQELKRRGHDFHLHFFGPGDTTRLKQAVREGRIDNLVRFHGLIPDSLDLERRLSLCGIGLAPYDPNLKDNFSQYADPSKIKVYLGCGLPVITTSVPPIARDLEEQKAGMIADLTPTEFAEKIEFLWGRPDIYQQYRENAQKLGETFYWPRIFDRLIHEEKIAV
ncbi:MAG: glycosyltransferase [Bdellovibrionales bacterium]